MLHWEFKLPVMMIKSTSDLRGDLQLDDAQINGLKRPIETDYFVDQNTSVNQIDLGGAQTVADLRDVIWDGTP